MFRILGRTATGAVALAGVAFFAHLTGLGSYVCTGLGMLLEDIEGSIPVEFELERAEGLVAEIDPQIASCKQDVARAEVEVERLEREIAELEGAVASRRAELERGATHLTKCNTEASPEVHTVVRDRMAADLARRLESHKKDRALLDAKRQLLDRQRAAVDAARERLFSVRAEREKLIEDIDHLRTQKMLLEAAVATSPDLELDDSPLGDARRVVAEVRDRLDVMQKVLDEDLFFAGGSHGEVLPAELVLAEVDEYLSGTE